MSLPSLNITLPDDVSQATLVGRIRNPAVQGPSIVTIKDGFVYDITSKQAPTMHEICELSDPATFVKEQQGTKVGTFEEIAANSDENNRDQNKPFFLSPIDLQVIKASGVTFVVSLLERVIEEQAKGDPQKAKEIRKDIVSLIGADLSKLVPGSPEAMEIKNRLIQKGVWSQYLEVGIGPDAEIFTKAPVLSSVGTGAHVGIHPVSNWNNPEPEIALAVSSTGNAIGAMLANDVNLRDVEGRSALLLGKAKDNNASCALGPFIRLFDATYSLDDVRACDIHLKVEGVDDFVLDGLNSLSQISRDPADLIKATLNENHQYPDGMVLLLGTMFAPVKDRDVEGDGFTHKINDVVTISAPHLGSLSNRVKYSRDCAPWLDGLSNFMRNLAKRDLLN